MIGDWDNVTDRYVYTCSDLDETVQDCGVVTNENVQIKVNRLYNQIMTINKAKISPNNLRNDPVEWWWSDVFVEFKTRTLLPYHVRSAAYPAVVVTIPSAYVVKTLDDTNGFNGYDWSFYCFPDFKAKCWVDGSNIILQPQENLVATKYSLWLLNAVKPPLEQATQENRQFYAFKAHTEWQNIWVDFEDTLGDLDKSP